MEKISNSPPTPNNIFGPPSLAKSPPIDKTYNLHPRPSLTPGANAQSDREERLLDAAYRQGYSDGKRLWQSHDDYFQRVLSQQCEAIRKAKIKRGELKPANEAERRIRRRAK